MKSFSEMGVTLTRRFTGDRIRIEKIEGDEIIVKDYKIEASKMKNQEDPNRCECLYLQLEVKGKDYVMWGSYRYLIDQIRQVTEENLPFKARIENEHGFVFK